MPHATRGPRKSDGEAEAEAQKFMDAYVANLAKSDNPKVAADPLSAAKANVGYLSGYGDGETMDRIRAVFEAAHPICGRVPSADLNVGGLMGAGMAAGQGRTEEARRIAQGDHYEGEGGR